MEASTRVFAHADLVPLLGLQHDDESFNCGHFVIRVQEHLFDLQADLPLVHPRGRRGRAAMLGRLSREVGRWVDEPVSGDIALYEQDGVDGGSHYHLGVVLRQAGQLWLLHLPERGESVMQEESQVVWHGLRRVGFYRLTQEAVAP